MKYQIIQGDNRETLKNIPDNSIDAIVTDPPYGIDFLGKDWDANTGALETYQECLRVLKPGGHILAFSAARTYHHLAVTLEQAGFEIRDQLMWIYSSGFPKSQDIGRSIQRSMGVKETRKQKLNINGGITNMGDRLENQDQSLLERKPEVDITVVTDPVAKQWEGWGTALKPAHEPICMARKPVKQSIAKNVQEWGTGALNIDAARIPYAEKDVYSPGQVMPYAKKVVLNEANSEVIGKTSHEENKGWVAPAGRFPSNVLGEIPDYQKYFYCPKVSRRERHMGFDLNANPTNPDDMCDDGVQFQEKKQQGLITNDEMLAKMGGHFIDEVGNKKETADGSNMLWLPHTGNIYVHGLKHEYEKWCKTNGISLGNVGNNHPTVKPVALMEYLIKLITPPGGTVLDPFNGSGSTGMAAAGLGFDYIGLELDPNYVEITQKRIEAWLAKDEPEEDNNFKDLFDEDAAE